MKKLSANLSMVDSFSRELKNTMDGYVFADVESPHRVVINKVDSVIYSRQSPYQKIDIFRTPHFGLCLALDGLIQVTEADEALYHEFLIHPAGLIVPDAASALVLGGGDGCATRELLKYGSLETIEMVEIDDMVIEACAEQFREVNAGALKNPRLRVVVRDAVDYLQTSRTQYDLIVADLTEPYDLTGVAGDLSREFYSTSFYEVVKKRMSPKGVLALQTGGVTNLPELDKHHRAILEGLCRSFPTVCTAYVHVHSFVQLWSITLASQHPYDVEAFDPAPSIERLRLEGLKYYNSVSHRKAFHTIV